MTIATRRVLDRELQQIQDDLLRMGSSIDAAVGRAMKALAVRDLRLAREVVAEDAQVNALRFQIEQACLTIFATQQPTATDLRMVVATIILASELERMGDYAAGIARTVLRMGDEPLLKPLVDMPRMAEIDREMLHDVLDAYVARDATAARSWRHATTSSTTSTTRFFAKFCPIFWKTPLAPRGRFTCSSRRIIWSGLATGWSTLPSASSL